MGNLPIEERTTIHVGLTVLGVLIVSGCVNLFPPPEDGPLGVASGASSGSGGPEGEATSNASNGTSGANDDTGSTGSTGSETAPAGDTSDSGEEPICGNGAVEAEEACDGSAPSCEELGLGEGVATCETCILDTSGCSLDGMVSIPGGTFTMGDGPTERQVTLSPYYIDAMEVTVAEYAECVDAGVCQTMDPGPLLNWDVKPLHPVNGPTWYDADAYCTWVGKQLPTEAQWERAARGPNSMPFPWGNDPNVPKCTHANIFKEGTGDCTTTNEGPCLMNSTTLGGSYELGKSAEGAYDLVGNLSEWVADWYVADYNPGDGTDPTGPMGPPTSTKKVIKGGTFAANDPCSYRGWERIGLSPDYIQYTVGFRCAWSPP